MNPLHGISPSYKFLSWCGLAARLTQIGLSFRQTPTVQAVVVRYAYAVPAALTSREQFMAAWCCAGASYGALWAVRGQGGRGRNTAAASTTARRSVWTSLWKEPAKHVSGHGVDEDDVRSAQATRRADPGATRRSRGVPASADSPPRHLQRPAQVLPDTGVNPRRATAAGPRPAARSARPEPQRHTLISPPGDHQAEAGRWLAVSAGRSLGEPGRTCIVGGAEPDIGAGARVVGRGGSVERLRRGLGLHHVGRIWRRAVGPRAHRSGAERRVCPGGGVTG